MNIQQTIIGWIRKPATVVAMVALVGLGLNLLFAFAVLSPKLIAQVRLDKQVDQLETQKKELSAKPIPIKVSDTEIGNLLKKVPLSDENAQLMLDLQAFIQKSGVYLDSIAFNNDSAKSDTSSLEATIKNAANAQAGVATPTPSPTPTSAPDASSSGTGASQTAEGLEETKLSVKFVGTYDQLLDVVNRIGNNERLIQLRDWSFKSTDMNKSAFLKTIEGNFGKTDQSSILAQIEDSKLMIEANLQLSVFTSKTYNGKLTPPTGSPGTEQPASRTDPTSFDEQFTKIVEQLHRQRGY